MVCGIALRVAQSGLAQQFLGRGIGHQAVVGCAQIQVKNAGRASARHQTGFNLVIDVVVAEVEGDGALAALTKGHARGQCR